eukprot:4220185-Amphidinium_carterae.2
MHDRSYLEPHSQGCGGDRRCILGRLCAQHLSSAVNRCLVRNSHKYLIPVLSHWACSSSSGSYATVVRLRLAYQSIELFNAILTHSILMSLPLFVPQERLLRPGAGPVSGDSVSALPAGSAHNCAFAYPPDSLIRSYL